MLLWILLKKRGVETQLQPRVRVLSQFSNLLPHPRQKDRNWFKHAYHTQITCVCVAADGTTYAEEKAIF